MPIPMSEHEKLRGELLDLIEQDNQLEAKRDECQDKLNLVRRGIRKLRERIAGLADKEANPNK